MTQEQGGMSADVATAPSSIEELKLGSEVRGTVKKIELFGAFVDIGVGQDALLHISQLGKSNVRNVEDVVKVDEEVVAFVIRADKAAGKIALSLEKPPAVPWESMQAGAVLNGTVVRIEDYGVFVDVGAERPGMVHVSELSDEYVTAPGDVVTVGEAVEVRVLKVNPKKRRIDLSMKTQGALAKVQIDESEEDEEEAVPTAMELALRRAMEGQPDADGDERQSSKRSKRAKQANENELEDILSRTLRDHSTE